MIFSCLPKKTQITLQKCKHVYTIRRIMLFCIQTIYLTWYQMLVSLFDLNCIFTDFRIGEHIAIIILSNESTAVILIGQHATNRVFVENVKISNSSSEFRRTQWWVYESDQWKFHNFNIILCFEWIEIILKLELNHSCKRICQNLQFIRWKNVEFFENVFRWVRWHIFVVRIRATSQTQYHTNSLNIYFVCFFHGHFRRRERQVLVNAIIRHTRCVAVAAVHHTIFKNRPVHNAAIQQLRSGHVSRKRHIFENSICAVLDYNKKIYWMFSFLNLIFRQLVRKGQAQKDHWYRPLPLFESCASSFP